MGFTTVQLCKAVQLFLKNLLPISSVTMELSLMLFIDVVTSEWKIGSLSLAIFVPQYKMRKRVFTRSLDATSLVIPLNKAILEKYQ